MPHVFMFRIHMWVYSFTPWWWLDRYCMPVCWRIASLENYTNKSSGWSFETGMGSVASSLTIAIKSIWELIENNQPRIMTVVRICNKFSIWCGSKNLMFCQLFTKPDFISSAPWLECGAVIKVMSTEFGFSCRLSKFLLIRLFCSCGGVWTIQ